jgi:hypothetical protein
MLRSLRKVMVVVGLTVCGAFSGAQAERALVTVTQTWAQVASGKVIVTIAHVGRGAIYFNEEALDDTAYQDSPKAGDQYQQTANIPTFVRSTGDGWKVLVDGAL